MNLLPQYFHLMVKEFHLLQVILEGFLHIKITELNAFHIFFGQINVFRLYLLKLLLSHFQNITNFIQGPPQLLYNFVRIIHNLFYIGHNSLYINNVFWTIVMFVTFSIISKTNSPTFLSNKEG